MEKNGIIRVHIQNFKRIDDIEAQLDGNSVFLIGDNEVGKTSFMQAVFGLLSNKGLPERAIQTGKTDGKIEIEFMVDGRKFTAIKKFTEKNPDGYFEIESADGLKTQRLSFLESLVGNISFNPFDFVDMCNTAEGRRKQVDFLRHLIDPAVNKRIDDINRDHKLTYESRSRVNTTIKQLDGEIAGIQVPDPEVYSKRVDINDLMNQLLEANKVNGLREVIHKDIERGTAALATAESEVTKLKKALKAAELERDRVQKKLEALNVQYAETKPVPTSDIESKIKTASDHNSNYDTLQRYVDLKKRHEAETKSSLDLGSKLMDLQTEKSDLIRQSNLPVDGLTFDENGLFINNLPLDEKQVATSVIMDLGVRIAVAVNPKLKILQIPRGESLGKKRMDEIVKFATANGYQLFVERVESGVEKLTIQFIEHAPA